MKRTSIRRPISLLLAALLLLGMLAVGGAGTLTASAAISNEAAVVVFKVPETIWLKLENSTTMKTPDKFSNIDDGAGAGVSDTGTVYFSCPGATNITITSDYGTSLTNATSPLSKDMGKTALSTGVTTNTAALVTWTAKFNLPGKGATQYTAKAYSMVWAPSINAFGTTASASTYPFLASRVYAASCLGILGLHSVGGGSGTNSRPNDTFRNDWINGSYCGVDNTWADTTYTSNGSNPNGANSFNHVDNQPGTGNSNAKPSNTNTSNYITVDRSRFTNLNQIPGLRLAFAQTKDDNSNSSWDSNLYFGGALIWSANSGPNQHEGLYGWTSSLIYEITQDDTEQTATATAKFKSSYSSSVQAENNHTISFYVKKANKGTLRGEIKKAENGTTKRYPDEFVTGANATFYSNLQTAVKSLGDPKAAAASYTAPAGADTLKGTTGTATANHIDTQTGQNIETSWMNPKSGTETLAYTYGDVVTAGKETFTGYSYTNRYDSPAATGQTGTGSAYTATESSIRWNFYYDRNNFESNEAVRIITAADSTGKTTPGYYAYVDASPVASGSTIASVSFPTWTDANGQDDLTWHAGTNSSGNHWVTQVPRSGHNGEGGSYATHIYAYDSLGGQNHWDNLKTFSVQFPQVTFYLNTTDQTTVVKTDYCGIGQVWNGTNTPQTGDPRNTYTNMCVPTAPGSDWVFLGWSTNPAAATADYNWVISDPNITAVYAVWQRLYTITFKRGLDGTTYGSHVYSGGSLLTAWTTLDGGKTYATVQGGDAIEGWYTDAEMTNKVNAAVWQVSGAATLYSKLENATRPGINLITTREQAGTYLSGKELPAGFATVADLQERMPSFYTTQKVGENGGSDIQGMPFITGWNSGGNSGYYDYYAYTAEKDPLLVFEVTDALPNGAYSVNNAKFTVELVSAGGGAVATVNDATRVGSGANKYLYYTLAPDFSHVAEGARAYAAYRITFTDAEGGQPGTKRGLADAFQLGGESATVYLDNTDAANEAAGKFSFTVYVAYLERDIGVTVSGLQPSAAGSSAAIVPLPTDGSAQTKWYAGLYLGHTGFDNTWEINNVESNAEAYNDHHLGNISSGHGIGNGYYRLTAEDADKSVAEIEAKIKANPGLLQHWVNGSGAAYGTVGIGANTSSAMKNQEKAYVYLSDRFGNTYSKIVNLANIDNTVPAVTNTNAAGGTVSVTESGGSGIKAVYFLGYQGSGGPEYVKDKLSGALVTQTSSSTASITLPALPLPLATIFVEDNAGNKTTATIQVNEGAATTFTLDIVDNFNAAMQPFQSLVPLGFEPLNLPLLTQAEAEYPVDVNGTATVRFFALPEGIVAIADPAKTGGEIRVLTTDAVDLLALKNLATGQSRSYRPGVGGVTAQASENGTLLWRIPAVSEAGDLLIYARIDGEWAGDGEAVPAASLPQLPEGSEGSSDDSAANGESGTLRPESEGTQPDAILPPAGGIVEETAGNTTAAAADTTESGDRIVDPVVAETAPAAPAETAEAPEETKATSFLGLLARLFQALFAAFGWKSA